MAALQLKDVSQYVEENIGTFHQKRIRSVDRLVLNAVLKRKNPYLFKAKNVATAEQIIRGVVDAHISSNEETIFGEWLEGLAIFINGKVFGGYKSGITGIDLEFDKDGKRYIITIKSGPNWGNSSQIRRMIDDFKKAQKTIRTSNSKIEVVSINGCCYGKDANPDKGDYFKYCGQRFWEFISGDPDLYIEIIEPIGFKAKERNTDFENSYSRLINRLTAEFSREFCEKNGQINWKKIVELNSSILSIGV
ncbi:MAG TPA: PmeII family type II restriction endonuclease [Bacteroidota bacterium]|nr:PmeII family type II restriction endonuclease [Bacteroidota bacterium]